MAIREEVRERDGNRCVRCGLTNEEHVRRSGKSLHVHRKDDRGCYELDNCVTFCAACHALTRTLGARLAQRRGEGQFAPGVLEDID